VRKPRGFRSLPKDHIAEKDYIAGDIVEEASIPCELAG